MLNDNQQFNYHTIRSFTSYSCTVDDDTVEKEISFHVMLGPSTESPGPTNLSRQKPSTGKRRTKMGNKPLPTSPSSIQPAHINGLAAADVPILHLDAGGYDSVALRHCPG